MEVDSLQANQPEKLFHGIMFTVAWVLLEQIAIWSLLLRSKSSLGIFIHGASFSIIVLMAFVAATQMIMYKGVQVILKAWQHTMLGFMITLVVPGVAFLGFYAKDLQTDSAIDPLKLDRVKNIHIIAGWFIIAASRIPLYDKWIIKQPILFLVLIVVDLVATVTYFYFKVNQVRMESVSIRQINQKSRGENWLREIKKQSDLEVYHGDYFIFADYVYRLTPVLTSHPGGFKIVNQVRGREVDRFLYGIEPLEKFENVVRVSHTVNSIQLAGPPIARLERPNLYLKMDELSPAKISATNFYQSSKRIYTIYLRPKLKNYKTFSYTGYTDISQLGKYFAVTIQGKKTRLYTMVNFLHKKTVKLVEQITKGKIFTMEEKTMLKKEGYGEENHFKSILNWEHGFHQNQEKNKIIEKVTVSQVLNQTIEQKFKQAISQTQNQIDQNNVIPLLIKKYDKGQFTSVFLNNKFRGQILISPPRGRGLGLQDIYDLPKPYKVIMFSGGTGIYPFADIIDLSFKQLLMEKELLGEEMEKLRNAILHRDPILEKKPFKDFTFTLYISVPFLEEIHPVTLFQCEFLAIHKKMRVLLKSQCPEDKKILKERYPHIEVNDSRYENLLYHLKQEEISRIYICGPTRMTKAIQNELQRLYWSPNKYVIV